MNRQIFQRALVLAAIILLPASGHAGGALGTEPVRFDRVGQLIAGRADWVTIDGMRAAFGSGRQVHLTEGPASIILRSLELDAPVLEAVLVENRLYLNHGRWMSVLDLDSPVARPVPLRLEPTLRGALHVARMVDFLVIAEDDLGLRLLALPPSIAMPEMHRKHFPSEMAQIALFPLEERFTALATSGGETVYAATDDRRIAVVHTGRADFGPHYLAIEDDARAMAANGSWLYVLESSGLKILDLTGVDGPAAVGFYPDLRGGAIALAGRSVLIAGADLGLLAFRDQSSAEAIINVSVGSFFFTPANVTVNVGDMVEWTCTSGLHSTQACNGEMTLGHLCAGEVANEMWKGSGVPSGNPSSCLASWNFSHTFTQVGFNPYVCGLHTTSMFGTVTVNAPAAPPGVPDGSGVTTPLTVSSLNVAGTSLSVAWDTATCPQPTEYKIIAGLGSQLPAVLGGTYLLNSVQCNIGTTSPFTWNSVPDPVIDPSRLLWFLVLANQGPVLEGSWGKDSAAGERDGPGTNGSSAQCGITDKSLTNACGQ